jgi:hypothetical protein
MSNWTFNGVTVRKAFIKTKDKDTGKEVSIPIQIPTADLLYKCVDGSTEKWTITMHNGKFNIKYPEYTRPVQQYGYYRGALGYKTYSPKHGTMDAETALKTLAAKVGREIAIRVVSGFLEVLEE